MKRAIGPENSNFKNDSFTMDILTVIIGMIGLQSLFLTSTYACTHQWKAFGWAVFIVAICAVGLYFTWYKKLPDKDEDVQLEPVE